MKKKNKKLADSLDWIEIGIDVLKSHYKNNSTKEMKLKTAKTLLAHTLDMVKAIEKENN